MGEEEGILREEVVGVEGVLSGEEEGILREEVEVERIGTVKLKREELVFCKVYCKGWWLSSFNAFLICLHVWSGSRRQVTLRKPSEYSLVACRNEIKIFKKQMKK